ncbi:MAG TPA: alpha/beta fold hydrolase [Polyangiaceae bacterium]|nr:alpha/beta fold hydrolase [Polyangiaceae bacterium]
MYKSGREIGREEYQDDGDTLVSRISLGGRNGVVRTSRSSRTVEVEEGPNKVHRDIPAGTVALENGDWQAYAIAAEWCADAHEPRPVQVLVPGQGAVVEGTIVVANGAGGRRNLTLTMGALIVTVAIDAEGRVIEARVPAQAVEVRPPGGTPPTDTGSPPRAALPAGVAARVIEVQEDGGKIAGEIWTPKAVRDAAPLAVIIPGSGPTDRDGNSTMGLHTDAYRQIAAALAERGIATLRYDKRGIGASRGYREDGITLTSTVRDLIALVREAQASASFSSVTLVGHSEGGVVALEAIADVHPAALVLLATPGRNLGAVLREQLIKSGVPAAEIDEALVETRKGSTVSSQRRELNAVFRPSVLPFLRSMVDVDPARLLGDIKVPTTIVQGDSDRQVTLEDAERLHAARPDARLIVIRDMNHVLKTDRSQKSPQPSYTDPAVPLASAVIDAIADASRR